MKIGKCITMYFHCFGTTSKEKTKVVDISDDYVYLERDDDRTWKFDRKTGECLNDETMFGAKRTIDPV